MVGTYLLSQTETLKSPDHIKSSPLPSPQQEKKGERKKNYLQICNTYLKANLHGFPV